VVKQIKIIVEKHADGYVAYPVGLKGVVVAQGDSYDAALADVRSAIEFHLETFGREVLEEGELAEEVFIAEAGVTI
jgi:predicted RNase H-like HicB family nuclease